MRPSKKYTVLYVDDEPANLRSFKSAFRRLYKVHIADHPDKALEILKENEDTVNIVVSDHRMPDVVGTDLLRKVHDHDAGIRRIILSGFVKKEELQDANNEYGIHAYISKPWDFDNVQSIFERLMADSNPPAMTYD